MSEVKLAAETGRKLGSSDSRRARKEDKIPAVVYGLDLGNLPISVDRKEFRQAMSTDAGTNALIKLEVGGETDYALVVDFQRHPTRREITHIDFLRVDVSKLITVDVPIHLTGEPKAVLDEGGIVEQLLMTLSVDVKPNAIPTEFLLDISGMDLETTITVADVSLPADCETTVDPTDPVVSASVTRAEVETPEVELDENGDPIVAVGEEGEGEAAEGEAADGEASSDSE